jgi:hypothetical protein
MQNEAKSIFLVSGPDRLNPVSYSIRFGIKYLDGSIAVAKRVEMIHYKPNEPVYITRDNYGTLGEPFSIHGP